MIRIRSSRFYALEPRLQARLRAAIMLAAGVLLCTPWLALGGIFSNFPVLGIPLGYLVSTVIFPLLLVFLLFRFARKMADIERRMPETEHERT